MRQHVELAAFLWAQRDTMSLDDPADAGTIGEIDQRVEANLDGLRIAGPAAWPAIDTVIEDFHDKGELFVVGWMAVEQSDPQRLDKAVELARQFDQPRGVVGALAWHTVPKIGPLLRIGWAAAMASSAILAWPPAPSTGWIQSSGWSGWSAIPIRKPGQSRLSWPACWGARTWWRT